MIAWLIRRRLADALDHRYPVRRLYWLSRFAGGPLRALRRWWALRKTRVPDAEYLQWSAGLARMQGESEHEFRGRLLHHLAGQPAIVPPDRLRGVAVHSTVIDEAEGTTQDADG